MSVRRKYIKKPGNPVVAVQLDLKTEGFTYEKWERTQTCKPGDWLVDNGGDIYHVDRAAFERTYRRVGPGLYEKVTPVWAARAESSGYAENPDGATHYDPGDYIVYNDEAGEDAYAMSAESFESMYERAP